MTQTNLDYRLNDLTWLLRRIESYHRDKLIKKAGVPEATLQTVFVKPPMQATLKELCSTAAGWLERLEDNPDIPSPDIPDTHGNKVPPITRSLATRAGVLAGSILRDGILREQPPHVTAARTAIFAGWQFMRWEGGRPMDCLSPANDAAAAAIDAIIGEARRRAKGKEWSMVSPLVNWQKVTLELAKLFIGHGACSPAAPRAVNPRKVCHSEDARPKDPQPPVHDEGWADFYVYANMG